MSAPLRLHLNVSAESASEARRFIRENAALDSMRHAEAGLLITELIGNVLRHASDCTEMTLSLESNDERGLRISLTHPYPEPLDSPAPGIGFTLLDRLSRRWDHAHDGQNLVFSFVVRTPGVTTVSDELPDEVLFERMEDDPGAYGDALVRRHQGLAEAIARRYRGKGIDDDDLFQVARMALLKAIQGYDPKVGQLRPYAAATVSGEMKKLLRDRGWSIRVPRSLQEHALWVARARRELGQRLGREAETSELAAHLDLSEEEVLDALRAQKAYNSRSIEAPSEQTGIPLGERLEGDDWGLLSADDRLVIEDAIAQLPERSRHILALRFNEDMTQSEIAEIIGVSQMHVSRLIAAALEDLRELMSSEHRESRASPK